MIKKNLDNAAISVRLPVLIDYKETASSVYQAICMEKLH